MHRLSLALLVGLVTLPSAFARDETLKVIVADATYVMGDSDTLAGAEENALLRAKRKAVEEAGVYIEAMARNVERYSGGATSHLYTLSIRTVSAAITETEILDKRRTLEGDRLAFYVKIRATVQIDKLEEAIKRQLENEQLAEHHRQLEAENTQLKSELDRLRRQLRANSKASDPAQAYKNRQMARDLVRRAVRSHSLPDKVDLTTRAIVADDQYADAYIVRGQTYLRITSLAFAEQKRRAALTGYIEQAVGDFERALALDPANTWALLGHGDALTWQHKMDTAARDYERILQIDPLFDVARQRLISLHTATARKQVAAKQYPEALATLGKIIEPNAPLSWVAQEKDAYLLRAQVLAEQGQNEGAVEDLSTVIKVDPTNAQALVLRAKLYQRQMQGRSARDDFERACSLGAQEACAALP